MYVLYRKMQSIIKCKIYIYNSKCISFEFLRTVYVLDQTDTNIYRAL